MGVRPLDHGTLTRTSRSEPAPAEQSLADRVVEMVHIAVGRGRGHALRVGFPYFPLRDAS